MKQKLANLDELNLFVKKVLEKLKPEEKAVVLALHGNLGAGKTTFAQHLARELGVEGEITSPTFVIFKRYETPKSEFKNLVHVDAYRLESKDELKPLKFDEVLKEEGTLVVIEWPENIEGALPDSAHHVYLEIADDNSREVEYS